MYREYRPSCVEQLFKKDKNFKLKGKYLYINAKKLVLVDPTDGSHEDAVEGLQCISVNRCNKMLKQTRKRCADFNNEDEKFCGMYNVVCDYKPAPYPVDNSKSCHCHVTGKDARCSDDDSAERFHKNDSPATDKTPFSNRYEKFLNYVCEKQCEDYMKENYLPDSKQQKVNNKIFISGQQANSDRSKFHADSMKRLCFASCMQALLKAEKISSESQTEDTCFCSDCGSNNIKYTSDVDNTTTENSSSSRKFTDIFTRNKILQNRLGKSGFKGNAGNDTTKSTAKGSNMKKQHPKVDELPPGNNDQASSEYVESNVEDNKTSHQNHQTPSEINSPVMINGTQNAIRKASVESQTDRVCVGCNCVNEYINRIRKQVNSNSACNPFLYDVNDPCNSVQCYKPVNRIIEQNCNCCMNNKSCGQQKFKDEPNEVAEKTFIDAKTSPVFIHQLQKDVSTTMEDSNDSTSVFVTCINCNNCIELHRISSSDIKTCNIDVEKLLDSSKETQASTARNSARPQIIAATCVEPSGQILSASYYVNECYFCIKRKHDTLGSNNR